jgi:hypothetical protein
VKTAVVALLAAGVVGFGAGNPAEAAGKSGLLYNCFTQWWNTAYAQGCEGSGAKHEGRYKSEVDCSFADSGRSYTRRWQKGETGLHNGGSCTYGVTNGWIYYAG